MTQITTSLLQGGYYQLNGPQPGSPHTGQASGGARALSSALLRAVPEAPARAVSNAAYLLDLSPAARQYLASHAMPHTSAAGTGAPSFTLNARQHQQVIQILAKYKDEPFTQENFNRIQDELHQAGLGAQQLAMKEKTASFRPTQILVNALSGRGAGRPQPAPTEADMQARAARYMQQIIQQWRQLSTTAGAGTDAS